MSQLKIGSLTLAVSDSDTPWKVKRKTRDEALEESIGELLKRRTVQLDQFKKAGALMDDLTKYELVEEYTPGKVRWYFQLKK